MHRAQIVHMADAEMDIDEVLSLGERFRMRVLREGGFSTPTQGARLRTCIELMRLALERERPNVGDEAVAIDRSDPQWAARAWVDNRIYTLEEALVGRTREEVRSIEEDAARLLVGMKPEWAWHEHQKVLVLRVRHRLHRSMVHAELIDLPEAVGNCFSEFEDFRVGDRSERGFEHEFNSREEVVVLNEEMVCRRRGYVCYEMERSIDLIGLNGNRFRKRKASVQRLPGCDRERIIDRQIQELRSRDEDAWRDEV